MITNDELHNAINAELDKAEAIWAEVSPHFIMERNETFSNATGEIPSKIPGFRKLKINEPEVADFIALILDIRGSSKNLMVAISEKDANVSQLPRVFFETTALYTAGALIIENYKGGITEYLGDGFLALFKIEGKDQEVVYNAYYAAQKCLSTTNEVVNAILKQRYRLPPLNIGIGMAYSRAIVTIVGTNENLHAKAIGECVYRASKLSNGMNEILIDKPLKLIWPKTKDGPISFSSWANSFGFDAFKLTKKTR